MIFYDKWLELQEAVKRLHSIRDAERERERVCLMIILQYWITLRRSYFSP